MFCHFCGVLGHDIRHCPVHYKASKKSPTIDYQYSNCLKAPSGRNRSPPRRHNARPSSEESGDKEKNHTVVSGGMDVPAKTAARVLVNSDMQPTQFGNNDLHRIEPNFQANISDSFSQVVPCMDNHVPCLAPKVDFELKLNEDDDNGPREANKEVGPSVTQPNKQIAMRNRLSRMEVGPNELNNPTSMLTFGKR